MCFVTRLASEYSIQFSEHMCFAPKREGKIQFRLSSSMLTSCNYIAPQMSMLLSPSMLSGLNYLRPRRNKLRHGRDKHRCFGLGATTGSGFCRLATPPREVLAQKLHPTSRRNRAPRQARRTRPRVWQPRQLARRGPPRPAPLDHTTTSPAVSPSTMLPRCSMFERR
jgi:hypothetical protein